MRPRSSLAPHSGAAVQTHSQLTVDAPPTGTTAPSTAQGALWMVLASGAVGVPPTSKGRHRSQRHRTSHETQIVALPTQWCGAPNTLPTDCGRAPNRDHRPKHRTGCAMDGVGKRCGRCGLWDLFLAHTCYLSPSKLTYNMLIDTGLCCLPKFMVVGTPPCLFVYARPNSNSWSNGPRKHSTCAHHLCLNGQHHIPHKTCIAYRVR